MNENELGWLVNANEEYISACDAMMVRSDKLYELFAGKKLVDAGAVVMSASDAAIAAKAIAHFEESMGALGDASEMEIDTVNSVGWRLKKAIEQARGENGN